MPSPAERWTERTTTTSQNPPVAAATRPRRRCACGSSPREKFRSWAGGGAGTPTAQAQGNPRQPQGSHGCLGQGNTGLWVHLLRCVLHESSADTGAVHWCCTRAALVLCCNYVVLYWNGAVSRCPGTELVLTCCCAWIEFLLCGYSYRNAVCWTLKCATQHCTPPYCDAVYWCRNALIV